MRVTENLLISRGLPYCDICAFVVSCRVCGANLACV